MNRANKFLALILAIMLIAAATGCTQNTQDGSDKNDFDISVPEDFPAAVGGAEFTDYPDAVVSMSPVVTEVIYALGVQSQLCAVSDNCSTPGIDENMPRVGAQSKIDTEKIIAMGADAVICAAEPLPSEMAVLETANIPVVVLDVPTDFDSVKDFYVQIATVFGGKSTGKSNGEKTYSRIISTLESMSINDGGRAVMIYEYGSAASGSNTPGAAMIKYAGGENVLDKAGYYFTNADIAKAAPDYIFCKAADVEKIRTSDSLRECNAVKNGRVYAVDIDGMTLLGMRMVEAARTMNSIFGGETTAE